MKQRDEDVSLFEHDEDLSKEHDLPEDLYIPPEALYVVLDAFEGPLDLLLYLIRRQNLNILDIPVAQVTSQYMSYIDMMSTLKLELAGDYLVMAALLAEIKARMLLPRSEDETEDEEDPRAELVRRLLEYEVFKNAAENLDELPRVDRDVFVASLSRDHVIADASPPPVELRELVAAFSEVLERAKLQQPHEIAVELLSIRERMTLLMDRVNASRGRVAFGSLFEVSEGKAGVVVTFLALLELIRNGLVNIIQNSMYSPIYISRAT